MLTKSRDQIEVDLEELSPEVLEFVQTELDKAREHGISLRLPKSKSVFHKGVCCAGYFDEDALEFAVACGKSSKKWLSIFVHETCHIDQWAEATDIWYKKVNGLEPTTLIDEWIENKIELDPYTLGKAFDAIVNIELDCEKRSIEKIKTHNLPIKIDTYIRKSNAYVWSYRLIQETRDWDHSAAYETPEVWRAMPKHFDNDYNKLPDDIRSVFYQYIELLTNFAA